MMSRKLKNIVIVLMVSFFALVRAHEVLVEPAGHVLEPIAEDHGIDPYDRYSHDERYSSNPSTPEPIDAQAQTPGASSSTDVGLKPFDQTSQGSSASSSSDLPGTTSVQEGSSASKASESPKTIFEKINEIHKMPSAQDGLSFEQKEAIGDLYVDALKEMNSVMPKEGRDFVTDPLTEPEKIAISSVLEQLTALGQSDLFEQSAMDGINQLRLELENVFEKDAKVDEDFLINTLDNAKNAFESGVLSLEDVEEIILMSVEGRSYVPQKALDIISRIRDRSVDGESFLNFVKQELENSFERSVLEQDALAKFLEGKILEVDTLMGSEPDSLEIEKKFKEMAAEVRGAAESVKKLTSWHGLITDIAANDSYAFERSEIPTLLNPHTLIPSEKIALVDSYFKQPSPFEELMDGGQTLQKLKEFVGNNDDVLNLLENPISLTDEQKIAIANALLDNFKSLPIEVIPSDILFSIAHAKESSLNKKALTDGLTAEEKKTKQKYRDLTLAFKNPIYGSVYRGKDFVPEVKAEFFNYNMGLDLSTLLAPQQRYSTSIQALRELYNRWQQPVVPLPSDINTADEFFAYIKSKVDAYAQDTASSFLVQRDQIMSQIDQALKILPAFTEEQNNQLQVIQNQLGGIYEQKHKERFGSN